MVKNRKILQLPREAWLITLLPLGIILSYAAALVPALVEHIYSSGVYRYIGRPLSAITGVFPFSVAEVLVIGLVLFCLWKLITMCIKLLRLDKGKKQILIHFFTYALILFSSIYFAFVVLWGLNYHRQPFSVIANLDVQPASVSELVQVGEDIIKRANDLRTKVRETDEGIMTIPGGYKQVLVVADKGYEAVSNIYPELGGRYGNPKPVFLSKAMTITGIWGVYFPLTAEANVNVSIPDSMKPDSTCHEMAHQRGFAREDEANYIASVVCRLHPSYEFQYSGALSSLIHVMNAIYSHDPIEYKRLYAKYGEGVKRDLKELDEFNKSSEGVVGEISNKINDTYLKANMQEEGVQSYGRMVDLLIAEYRKK